MKSLFLVLSLLCSQVYAFECLPKKVNESFSGTEFATRQVKGVGIVHSWKCPSGRRVSLATLEGYSVDPMCSTFPLSTFRREESSALTTVGNTLRACGKLNLLSQEDQDKYHGLLLIGFFPVEEQESVATSLFGRS